MRAIYLLATVAVAQAPQNPAPLYVASSIVNAGSHKVEGLAPNTLVTLYGKYLSWTTRALLADDIRDGVVPTALGGSGVRVLVNRVPAPLLYVSPEQVNFLIPSNLTPGPAEIRLSLDARYGPGVQVSLSAAAPALFQWDPEYAVATRADGSPVTYQQPAAPGESLILYATGLGPLRPQPESGQIVRSPARLERMSDFRVALDGAELAPDAVQYAGAAPGFPGLYQVNLRLPEQLGQNPVVRIAAGGVWSQPGVRLVVKR